MKRIYMDQAATSFPKPDVVVDAVVHYMTEIGSNVGRGSYASAYQAEEVVYETRELLARLFHASDCSKVIFTKNVTEGLNLVLKGFLKPDDHVVVSALEHNAVMRPLAEMEKQGIRYSIIPADLRGEMLVNSFEAMLGKKTRAVVMTHAGNVSGTLNPIEKIGEICARYGIRFIVDAAQTAGVFPIDMKEMHIDALCFTGHKGILGPQGIGGVVFANSFEKEVAPLVLGGTGSVSDSYDMPTHFPDRMEAGTLNIPGIYGLNASLKWLEKEGIQTIREHEMRLTKQFLEGLEKLEQNGLLRIVGPKDAKKENRTAVVSVRTEMDGAEVARRLEEEYGIQTRVGLHCAPLAHRTLGTFPQGTVRFSFGYANTSEEIAVALNALECILRENGSGEDGQ